MALEIIITVVATSIIQSIFGVGVLLFGTPILLAFGYEFIEVIIILLPISLTISLFQIIKDYRMIDTVFYKKIVIYSIPFVVIFLILVTRSKINIGMIIGMFLIFVAIKDYSHRLNNIIESLTKHERIYLITMGIIHGTTNLGGSLLTAIVHNKKYEKNVTRATVAVSYATFAIFQIATLLFSDGISRIKYVETTIYLIVGVIIYLFIGTTIYVEISSYSYKKYFAIFLFSSGVLLCFKSI